MLLMLLLCRAVANRTHLQGGTDIMFECGFRFFLALRNEQSNLVNTLTVVVYWWIEIYFYDKWFTKVKFEGSVPWPSCGDSQWRQSDLPRPSGWLKISKGSFNDRYSKKKCDSFSRSSKSKRVSLLESQTWHGWVKRSISFGKIFSHTYGKQAPDFQTSDFSAMFIVPVIGERQNFMRTSCSPGRHLKQHTPESN